MLNNRMQNLDTETKKRDLGHLDTTRKTLDTTKDAPLEKCEDTPAISFILLAKVCLPLAGISWEGLNIAPIIV